MMVSYMEHPILLKELGIRIPEGFFYSPKFYHYQKVNKGIYVYVTPEYGRRWKVQAYLRGTTFMCSLEARINWEADNEHTILSEIELLERYKENIEKLFNLGDKWLQTYGEQPDIMKHDKFNPFHPEGWRGEDITLLNDLYQD